MSEKEQDIIQSSESKKVNSEDVAKKVAYVELDYC